MSWLDRYNEIVRAWKTFVKRVPKQDEWAKVEYGPKAAIKIELHAEMPDDVRGRVFDRLQREIAVFLQQEQVQLEAEHLVLAKQEASAFLQAHSVAQPDSPVSAEDAKEASLQLADSCAKLAQR